MNQMTFDEAGFGTQTRRIPWNELVAVGIRTTAEGPFAEDVFWQFLVRGGLVELAGSQMRDLEALGKWLPGFDYLKVIKAMGSCEDRIFRVWHFDESPRYGNEAALRARFIALGERLGASGGVGAEDVFARLHSAWSSSGRRYHDLEHLSDCLREVERVNDSPVRDRVELALWYHDAVYEPGARDCEERSAAMLLTDAAALGLGESVASVAAALVRATAHGAGEVAGDEAALVADIDLAILGRDPLRFMEFEYGVEEEFGRIPTIVFRRGRGRFLAALLERPIYRTPAFHERFEVAARANIGALLRSPRYIAYRWLRWLPC
jgi:predicted metal-dependent HD superfamily phosphohydrolase